LQESHFRCDRAIIPESSMSDRTQTVFEFVEPRVNDARSQIADPASAATDAFSAPVSQNFPQNGYREKPAA